jgi:hypothetical protein
MEIELSPLSFAICKAALVTAEPVSVRRFKMRLYGDWGSVLFIHPPAAVHFNVTLPDTPTDL